MSTARNDGGPDFPISRETDGWYEPGMSMRDWFAGQALAGLLAAQAHVAVQAAVHAAQAYVMADAMIEHRSRTMPGSPKTD